MTHDELLELRGRLIAAQAWYRELTKGQIRKHDAALYLESALGEAYEIVDAALTCTETMCLTCGQPFRANSEDDKCDALTAERDAYRRQFAELSSAVGELTMGEARRDRGLIAGYLARHSCNPNLPEYTREALLVAAEKILAGEHLK